MNSSRKTKYINATCPLALVVYPDVSGRYTFAAIDYAKCARVIQKSFPDEEIAMSEGARLAEEYAVCEMQKAFKALEWASQTEEDFT